MGSKYVDQPYA